MTRRLPECDHHKSWARRKWTRSHTHAHRHTDTRREAHGHTDRHRQCDHHKSWAHMHRQHTDTYKTAHRCTDTHRQWTQTLTHKLRKTHRHTDTHKQWSHTPTHTRTHEDALLTCLLCRGLPKGKMLARYVSDCVRVHVQKLM